MSVELSLAEAASACWRLARSLSSSTKQSWSLLVLTSASLAAFGDCWLSLDWPPCRLLLSPFEPSGLLSLEGVGGGGGLGASRVRQLLAASLPDESEVAPLQEVEPDPSAEPDVASVEKVGEPSWTGCIFVLAYEHGLELDADEHEGDRKVDRCCLVSRWLNCCWTQLTMGGAGSRSVGPADGQSRNRRGWLLLRGGRRRSRPLR